MSDSAGASATAPAQPKPLATSSTVPSTTTNQTTTTSIGCTSECRPKSAHRPMASQSSIDSTGYSSVQSQTSHKEYLDRLVVPSQDELARIAEVQKTREAELRRQSREQRVSRQRSLEACDRAAAAAAAIGGGSCSGSGNGNGGHTPLHTSSRHASHGPKEGHGHLTERFGFKGLDGLVARSKAAVVIQRHYRGYRARREMKGFGINANTRWVHAIREARYRELTRPRARAELEVSASQSAIEGRDDSNTNGNNNNESAATLDQPSVGQTPKSESNALRNWKKATNILKYASLDQDSDSDADDDADSDCASDSGSDGDPDADRPSFHPGSYAFNTSHSSQRRRQQRAPEDKQSELARLAEARARRRRDARTMGLQYFLEMIDLKHRYGANLRVYHEEWKRSDTKENFFYWLDYGEGRLFDTTACPRARLDREQVRYLSREERQYYLVKIDKEGRLCWAKNGARIDTTAKWKDSIHGIVPVNDPTPAFKPVLPTNLENGEDHHHHHHHHGHHPNSDSESDSDSDSDFDPGYDVSENELAAARAAKYTIPDNDSDPGGRPSSSGSTGGGGVAKKAHHFSATTVFDSLMRKSVRKNTWIFVADTSFRLYVGLKDSGTFQHSSFLQGARISAAGLIKIRNGRLDALSPLSGHYRPPVANFRAFVLSLREEGADMRHVSISKAYVVLVGLEAYMRTRQQGKKLLRKLSRRGGHGGGEAVNTSEGGAAAAAAAAGTAATTTTTGRLLQKLHIRSASHEDEEASDGERNTGAGPSETRI